MTKSNLLDIPGIGKTFVKDFARINIYSISDLADQNADQLFLDLCRSNEMVAHKTSKNYLYVICMVVYHTNGGRNESKLHRRQQRITLGTKPISLTIRQGNASGTTGPSARSCSLRSRIFGQVSGHTSAHGGDC